MDIKKGIPQERQQEALDFAHPYFAHVMTKADFDYYIKYESDTNWNQSALLLDAEDKILGVYVLGDHQITNFKNSDFYRGLKGVEGVVLAVDESIRGQGWGNKLKDYPKSLGIDYIWGQQFKDLKNLNHWLKRRSLVTETKYIYITAEVFV